MRIDSLQEKFKNKDAKTVITNFSWLSISMIAGYIFPLLTMPYLAKTIGAEGFGKIAFALAIVAWVQTIVDWGFNFTATRDVARCYGDAEKISEILSNVIWARLFLMMVCLLALFLLSLFIPSFRDNRTIIFVTFLMIPGHILCPDWFFQAIEKMKYITIFNLLLKLVFTLGVFIFIKSEKDVIIQPLLTSVGYFCCAIVSTYLIIFKLGFKILSPNYQRMYRILKDSTDVFVNNLLPNFYNSFSIVLLGNWGSAFSTGLFDAGNKFVNICIQFMSALSRAFFPFLSRRIDKHDIYKNISICLACVVSVILFVCAPLIVSFFFTPEFEPAILVMRIMAVSNVFLTLNSIYGTGYLIIVGKERLMRNINAISSLLGFGISFPLVYYFDYIGAALTITITRGIIGLTEMYYSRKNMKLSKV